MPINILIVPYFALFGAFLSDEAGDVRRRHLHSFYWYQATVLYAEPDDLPLKGSYVEAGIALSLGLRVGVVAPEVADVRKTLGSWTEHPLVTKHRTVLDALSELARKRVKR